MSLGKRDVCLLINNFVSFLSSPSWQYSLTAATRRKSEIMDQSILVTSGFQFMDDGSNPSTATGGPRQGQKGLALIPSKNQSVVFINSIPACFKQDFLAVWTNGMSLVPHNKKYVVCRKQQNLQVRILPPPLDLTLKAVKRLWFSAAVLPVTDFNHRNRHLSSGGNE